MKDPRIIFHVSSELKKFFFSIDHCQPKVHNSYVPITSYVDNRIMVRAFWGEKLGYKEVPNPDPSYEPKFI
jgi:hypothetical protein